MDIFVFGSNLLGVHGAGAARCAEQYHGAVRGKGKGLQGKSYAIPTKQTPRKSLPIDEIAKHVEDFIADAEKMNDKRFLVTKIGCGLAGYNPWQIAPLFRRARKLPNVVLPPEFKRDYN